MSEKITASAPTRFGSAIVIVLCAMAVLSVIAYGAVDTWALALMTAGSALIGWLWLTQSWRAGSFDYSSNLIQLIPAGLLLIALVQLLPLRSPDVSGLLPDASQTLTLDRQATIFAVIKLVVYLIFFGAALAFIVTKKRFRRVAFTIVIFGALIAVFAIFQKLVNPDQIYGTRVTVQASTFGPYVNGHHFAGLMEMTFGLTLALISRKTVRKELRVLFLAAALVMGAALMMTGSRGGMLSFLGVTGFVAIFTFFGKRAKTSGDNIPAQGKLVLIGGGLTFVLLVIGTGLLLGGDAAFRGLGIGVTGSDLSNGRLHFWSVALQIFKDYPLLGAGIESFGVAFTKYDTWNGAFRIEFAHNDYLQMMADAGIAGLLLVLGFIYLLFRGGLKNLNEASDPFHRQVIIGALAGCFGVMLHSFFDFPLRTPANMLMLLTLSALALVTLQDRSKRR